MLKMWKIVDPFVQPKTSLSIHKANKNEHMSFLDGFHVGRARTQ
jgi:hypothetical protein